MKINSKVSLFLTWLVLIISPVPLIIILQNGLIETPLHLFAYDCGIVAYVWWLMSILLATRPHWLEQHIGLPQIYALHGGLGVIAVIAATVHRFTSFSMFPLIKQTGNVAWYLEIFLLLYAILFLSGWLVDRLRSFAQLKSFLEQRFLNHQVTMWIHRLNWVVVVLIWLHVQVIPRLRSVPGFQLGINLYTGLTVLVYLYWLLRGRHNNLARVVKNVSLDNDLQILTLKFNQPTSKYRAGDYYFLSFPKSTVISRESHPFSVFSSPCESSNEVSFIIHCRGDFTKQLRDVLPGTEVKLEGPFGLFDREVMLSKRPLIFYGLGSGIVPLISLAKQYGKKKRIIVLWSGPQVNSKWGQDMQILLKKSGVIVQTQKHRFLKNDLRNILNEYHFTDANVIIVGSSNKVLQVRRTFHKLGVKRSQLHDERMTL